MTTPSPKQTAEAGRNEHRIRANDPDTIGNIRKVLNNANYAHLAIQALAERQRSKQVSQKRQSSESHPEHILIKLFFHGRPVDIKAASNPLKPVELSKWAELGLIELQDDRVIPLVKILSYRGLFVVSDNNWDVDSASQPNAVMGITSSTLWLSKLTVRRQSRSTLDLGTGTGVQAMLAAKHSDHVVAVDVNPRALDYARFNAQLNEISNIEVVQGDLFEPIEGKTFDLIVCNPPFSISPGFRCLYRDNPLDGDEFVRNIATHIPRFLRKGGHGQIVCNWVQAVKRNWGADIAGWFDQSGCDVWVIRGETKSPDEYTHEWLKGYDPPNAKRLYAEWTDYYNSKDIGSIGSGVITMRRSDNNPHWVRVDPSQPKILNAAGDHIQRGFRLREFEETRTDATLMIEHLRIPAHVRMDQQWQPSAKGWRLNSTRLTLTHGIAYSTKIDAEITQILLRCTGQKPLATLLQEAAIRAGKEFELVAPDFLKVFRKLITLGFVWPVEYWVDVALDFDPKSDSPSDTRQTSGCSGR